MPDRAEPFSNEPIPVDGLPQLRDEAFVAVDRRYLWGWLVALAGAAVLVVLGGSLVAWQVGNVVVPLAIAGGLVAAIAATAGLWLAELRRLAYQVREHDLSLRSGVIRHSVESVPFARVQHVSIRRGPVERALGLATLEVSSAGPNISIPGLRESDAARMKLLVTERAGVVDDQPEPGVA